RFVPPPTTPTPTSTMLVFSLFLASSLFFCCPIPNLIDAMGGVSTTHISTNLCFKSRKNHYPHLDQPLIIANPSHRHPSPPIRLPSPLLLHPCLCRTLSPTFTHSHIRLFILQKYINIHKHHACSKLNELEKAHFCTT
uniref:Uncharacterized protein n=1 Tax=Aegilops tauschii subsp. strangulata TaxID=200361 RepID=A0A453E3Q3_AEGTS